MLQKDPTKAFYSASEKLLGGIQVGMAMDAKERQLLERLKAGDPGAAEEIVDVYMSEAYDYLCMLSQDRDLAADLTQETMVRVWTHLDRFRGESSLKTWIKRIALNEYRQHLRRRKRREVEVDCEVGEIADPINIGEFVVDADSHRLIREAVEALPEIYRLVVVMHTYGGASLKEVSKALSIPLGTAKWRLSRAVQILRTRLTKPATGAGRSEEQTHVEAALNRRSVPEVGATREQLHLRSGPRA